MQKEEYLIKNAYYSVTKYYLCKRNNKRSLLGRKQQSQVARSFPNRYLISCVNKVTSLFSDRYIFIIILHSNNIAFVLSFNLFFSLQQKKCDTNYHQLCRTYIYFITSNKPLRHIT